MFQERPIVAADIGNTITFTFDAKQGNIESPTTAQAFLKTLDPGAGFSESSSDTLDTTSLGATWGTYTLAVLIDGTTVQVGHILQFGALSRAANFHAFRELLRQHECLQRRDAVDDRAR